MKNLNKFAKSIAFLGMISFAIFSVETVASADSVSVSIPKQEQLDFDKLNKIDTLGVNAEVYVNPEHQDDVYFLIDNEKYIIKDNTFVKDINIPKYGTYATDSWYVQLENGHNTGKHYTISKGTSTQFSTYGLPETRRMVVYGPNWDVIATVTGSNEGVAMVQKAKVTGDHGFYVQNFSATSQLFRCEVKF
ncbi:MULTISPECIES: hypothetical protein [unclassified Psychrobacillus]|uniref:hypothetical protein n=1 Tax=unclassified Psychrobacillus TaxID=2636677 RepID=UPI0030F724C1